MVVDRDCFRPVNAQPTLTRRYRALAPFLLLLHLFAGAPASVLRPCPHHLSLRGAAATGSGAHAHRAADSQEESRHEGPCTCVGACHESLAIGPLSTGPQVSTSTGVDSDCAPPTDPASLREGESAFLHALANPPPSDC